MKNKFLYLIIFIAIIISFISIYDKFYMETNNKRVELIIDNDSLNELAVTGKVEEDFLPKLKKKGITGVAVYEKTIEDLLAEDNIHLMKGEEIKNLQEFTGGEVPPVFDEFYLDDNSSFLLITEEEKAGSFLEYKDYWSDKFAIEFIEESGILLLKLKGKRGRPLTFPGFNIIEINRFREKGLKVYPRPGNRIDNHLKVNLNNLLSLSPEVVIFADNEVLGYDRGNGRIEDTARFFKNNNIKVGMIEPFLNKQQGIEKLVGLIDYNVLRVHTVEQDELDNYTIRELVARYVRAVRERNVRILHLKLFQETANRGHIGEYNLKFVAALRTALEKEGFVIGSAETFPLYYNPVWLLLLVAGGIAGGGVLLLEYLLDKEFGQKVYLIFAGLMFPIIILLYWERIIFARQILALTASIIFPLLAIIQLFTGREDLSPVKTFLKITGITLIGAVFVTAGLHHLSFLLKVNQYRGVKIAFVLPLIIIGFYIIGNKYFKNFQKDNFLNSLSYLLNIPIKVKYLLLGSGVLIFTFFLLVRTGNYSLINLLPGEGQFRNYLESILYIRPRFKEFLIGHPFLILSIVYRGKIREHLFYLLVLPALIGQINVINTFAHLHVPLHVSLIRTLNGIILGTLIGIVLYRLVEYFRKRASGKLYNKIK